MTNSRAATAGALILLGTTTLSGTATAIDYTSTLNFSKYALVKVVFSISPTATLTPRIELDDDQGSNYNYDNVTIPGLAEIEGLGQAAFTLPSLTTNYDMSGEINIFMAKGLGDKAVQGNIYIANTPVSYLINGQHAASSETITQISIKISTSTLKAGSFMSVYGLPK